MFRSSLGAPVAPEECIFPLVTFLPHRSYFKCLGTGFFINPFGGFITARHVFLDSDGQNVPTLYGIQSLAGGRKLVRSIRHVATHPNADIAIGMLGRVANMPRIYRQTPINPVFGISLNAINNGDNIQTYAFPQTRTEDLEDGRQLFTFTGRWSAGDIMAFHPGGTGLVRNDCYETSMEILDGASGGPVIRGNYVVGINSSAIAGFEDDPPVSFITPISFLMDMHVPSGGGLKSVESLVQEGLIYSE